MRLLFVCVCDLLNKHRPRLPTDQSKDASRSVFVCGFSDRRSCLSRCRYPRFVDLDTGHQVRWPVDVLLLYGAVLARITVAALAAVV